MPRSRPIPKAVFQLIALALLGVCFALTWDWIASDHDLYVWLKRALGSKALAGLGTFLVTFVAWLVLIIPIRLYSKMPTMAEELGVDLGDGVGAVAAAMKEQVRKERAEISELAANKGELTPEHKARARRIGAIVALVGVALGIATAVTVAYSWESGRLLRLQLVLALTSVALVMIGAVAAITGRLIGLR